MAFVGIANEAEIMLPDNCDVINTQIGQLVQSEMFLRNQASLRRRKNTSASDFRVLKHPATFNEPLRGHCSPRSGYVKVAGRFNARISPGQLPASRSDA